MKIQAEKGRSVVVFEEADERVAWQIVAARLKEGSATLRDEYVKTVEEMARLARTLRDDPIIRKKPSGEQWTFKSGDDGRLRIEITGEASK